LIFTVLFQNAEVVMPLTTYLLPQPENKRWQHNLMRNLPHPMWLYSEPKLAKRISFPSYKKKAMKMQDLHNAGYQKAA
jgi:hypothetical protein